MSGISPLGDGTNLEDILNTVHGNRKSAVESGGIIKIHWNSLKNISSAMLEAVGKDAPEELPPHDWSKMRAKWATELKPSTLANGISNVRAMINCACEKQYIKVPAIGPAFIGPSLHAMCEGA